MGFFDRLSNGWKISMSSFKVLNANKQLVIFPILSSISLLVVIGSFFTLFTQLPGGILTIWREPARSKLPRDVPVLHFQLFHHCLLQYGVGALYAFIF
ncbi:MAG: hypothetical protein WDO19_07480 [Bacteroidota bacterium]